MVSDGNIVVKNKDRIKIVKDEKLYYKCKVLKCKKYVEIIKIETYKGYNDIFKKVYKEEDVE